MTRMTTVRSRPEWPALSAADRERILTGFNVNNQAHFGGHLGFQCVRRPTSNRA